MYLLLFSWVFKSQTISQGTCEFGISYKLFSSNKSALNGLNLHTCCLKDVQRQCSGFCHHIWRLSWRLSTIGLPLLKVLGNLLLVKLLLRQRLLHAFSENCSGKTLCSPNANHSLNGLTGDAVCLEMSKLPASSLRFLTVSALKTRNKTPTIS